MPAPAYIRSSLGLTKRVKIDPLKPKFASLARQPVSHSFPMKATASRFGISTTAAEWQADVQSVPPHSGLESCSPNGRTLMLTTIQYGRLPTVSPRLIRRVGLFEFWQTHHALILTRQQTARPQRCCRLRASVTAERSGGVPNPFEATGKIRGAFL